MATKSPVQQFQTSWQKTANWAKSQGIPQSSIYPVYQLDSKRLLQGSYPMSEAERTRAILASSNPNNVTPLPSDKPASGIGGFFGNVEHDASNIFTGLQPTHLVTSIFDSVKNTVEHPNWLLDPSKNTLAQLVPGVSLIGEFEHGGIDNVLAHPLISFLNVLGIASAGTSLVAHTALGDTLASALGAGSREAIAKMGPTGIIGKAIGNVPTKAIGITKDPATGLPNLGRLSVAQKFKNIANTKGIGGDIADINSLIHGAARDATSKLEKIIAEGTVANAQLMGKTVDITSDHMAQLFGVEVGTQLDSVHAAWNLATLSGKSWAALRDDNSIPVEIKNMLPHYEAAERWIEETNLATGQLTKVRLPDGTYGVYSAAQGERITRAHDAVAVAEAKVDKLSGKADQLSDEIQHNDSLVTPAFDMLKQFRNKVNQAKGTALTDSGFSPDPGRMSRASRTKYAELRNRLDESRAVKDQSPQHAARHLADQQRLRDFVQKSANVKPTVELPTIADLLGVAKPTAVQTRLITEIYGTGGLIDKVMSAYQTEDFRAMRTVTLQLTKKFANKSLGGPETSSLLKMSKMMSDNLYKYAKSREKFEVDLQKTINRAGLKDAIAKHQKLQAAYEKEVWRHPSAAWQPLMVKLVNDKIAQSEKSDLAIEKALTGLKDTKKLDAKALEDFRQDPGRLVDLIRTYMKAGHEAPFGAVLDPGLIEEMTNSARNEIASLRAQGFEPHYIPSFSSRDSLGAYDPSEVGQIHLNPTRYMTPDSVKERMLDQSNTIYDIYAGQTRAMSQRIQSDSVQSLIDDTLIPAHGYKQSDLMAMVAREDPTFRSADLGTSQAYLAHLLEHTYDLQRFDPASFGVASSRHIAGKDTIWMPSAIVKGLHDVVGKGQSDSLGAVSTATNIFRTSVLGYSPRFVAHILFGGSFLVALRNPLAFFRMGQAFKMLKDDDFRTAIHTRSTQVGKDDPIAYGVKEWHRETGKTMGRLWANEMMDKLNLDPNKMTSWLKVIPQMTFKLTNAITDMQRAAVVLDGIKSAERKGYVLDEMGKRLDMTPQRALEEGIRTANKVMGDLSHMTPLERNVITTVVPFYGWTKHVLEYVATYPVDHPYRAMFLANLANMNSDEVSKGLYTRIQNLFFLGQPDSEGNVSALDVRALNPLRDVANYATIGGLISMLNPVISAPFAFVDPQAVFGSNVLYPNITYSQLYGVKSAAPSGNLLTVAEQFVPEVSSLDAAIGLSGQYRNLRKDNPNAFAKAIFGALNIPFAQVQHLNLKQIAATQEIDRYQQAAQAAQNAFSSGNFGQLAGYGDVPNPLQTDFNVSPQALEELYNQTLKQSGGIAPIEELPSLPAPAGL
jgi:hypothetical protein